MTITFMLLFTGIVRSKLPLFPQDVQFNQIIINVLEILVTIMLPVPSMIAYARKLVFLLPTLALK